MLTIKNSYTILLHLEIINLKILKHIFKFVKNKYKIKKIILKFVQSISKGISILKKVFRNIKNELIIYITNFNNKCFRVYLNLLKVKNIHKEILKVN